VSETLLGVNTVMEIGDICYKYIYICKEKNFYNVKKKGFRVALKSMETRKA